VAIALDGSTPAVATGTWGTSGKVTTASFSPPAGALVVVMAMSQSLGESTGPTLTVTDSASNAYTTAVSKTYTSGGGSACGIYLNYYTSAPGSVTVSVQSSDTTDDTFLVAVTQVLTGAYSSQSGAGTMTASGLSGTMTGTLTTTVTGSWAYTCSASNGGNGSWSVVSGETSLESLQNTYQDTGAYLAARETAATGTPGAVTMGFTGSPSADYALCALEILPAITGGTQTWTTAGGPYSWVCPSGVAYVYGQAWAGGGAGGEAVTGSGDGSGGGGGEYAADWIAVVPATTYYVYVGAGGTAAAPTGNTGAISTFGSTGGTIWLQANPGTGGGTEVHGAGAGGSGSANRWHYPGGSGGLGSNNIGRGGGGGGGSGGAGSAGNTGGTGAGYVAGAGATAVTGGGPGGNGAYPSGAGHAPASGPGGGGGGGDANGNNGGAGYAGQVILTWYAATGQSAYAAPAAALAGTGGVPQVNATSAYAAPAAALAGTGTSIKPSGTAAYAPPAPALAGAGTVIPPVTGTAAYAPPAPALAGSGGIWTGTAAYSPPAPALAAAGGIWTGTAAVAAPAPALTASGGAGAVVGSGAYAAPAAAFTASGLADLLAAAAIAAPAPAFAAAGLADLLATGGITIPPPALAAAGLPGLIGAAAVTVPAPAVAVTGVYLAAAPSLIISLAGQAGTDQYGRDYPQGLGVLGGVLSGSVTLLYTGTPAAGNLFYSNSPGPGTDAYGNVYGQGQTYYSVEDLTNVLTVVAPAGGTLSNLDSSGNFSGKTLSAATDLLIAGNSMQNTILPAIPQGIINRGWTPAGAWPSSPAGPSETALLELDQALTAGRTYRIRVPQVQWQMQSGSAPSALRLSIRYTTDGGTPGTGSTLLTATDSDAAGSAVPTAAPGLEAFVQPSVTGPYRFLVTGAMTSGTFQFTDSAGSLTVYLEDLGVTTAANSMNNGLVLGTGTGGGTGGGQTYTSYWTPAHTYSYYGGITLTGNPEYGLWNTDGTMTQGPGAVFADADEIGNCTSYILWPYAAIQPALSGATINWATLRLSCLSSANSDITVYLGYNGITSYGATDNPGAGTEGVQTWNMIPGQVLATTLTSAFAAGLAGGSVTSFQLGQPPTEIFGIYNPQYGGTFYGNGPDTTQVPLLTVNYTT